MADEMTIFPQTLINVRVTDKNEALTSPIILDEVQAVEEELGENGRVLVRPSGTEPLVRVMVEAKTEEDCKTYAERIVKVIENHLGA